MSGLLAVAARELRERWLLFPGAFVAGFFPLVLPAFGVSRAVLPTVGVAQTVLLGAAAAVVIGSSMLARDATNSRLGFLFSRPLPWGTIWGGKWLAAITLAVASAFLTAIPWMAAIPLASLGGHHGDSWLRAMFDGPEPVFFFVLIVVAVGLANFNATAFRSRSPWVALDLALLLAAFWATRRYVAPLLWFGLLSTDEWRHILLPVPLAVALLVGSMAQVAVGRTDVRRAHRASSLAFWAVVGLTLVTAAFYLQWIRSAGPADIRASAVAADPAGRWIYIEGSAERSGWYPHKRLIDTASGRYLAGPEPELDRRTFGSGILFSADGRFVALPGSVDENAAVTLFDLSSSTPRVSVVRLESSPPPTGITAFALSPSGASVFLVHESGASLYALPSGRRVATTTIGPGWRPMALCFLAEGTARAWLVPSGVREVIRPRADMRVVDLAADGSSRAVTFPVAAPPARQDAVIPESGGQRIITVDGGVQVRDGATGALLATLLEGEGSTGPREATWASRFPVLFLADGRILVGDGRSRAEPGPPRALVRVFDRAGVALGEMRLDLLPGGLSLGPEVAPGRIAVSSLRSIFIPEDTLLVDVAEGRVVERLTGLRPAMGFWNTSSIPVPAGSVHFFRDVESRVIRIDFATGERKIVAGPGAPRGERLSAR
jgi:hypothetical protein